MDHRACALRQSAESRLELGTSHLSPSVDISTYRHIDIALAAGHHSSMTGMTRMTLCMADMAEVLQPLKE
jgi:hypothetical protein